MAFAGQVDTLADFGLTARAKHVATPEEKLASTDKAKATRAARHTMGSKQKAAIKGTVGRGRPERGGPGGDGRSDGAGGCAGGAGARTNRRRRHFKRRVPSQSSAAGASVALASRATSTSTSTTAPGHRLASCLQGKFHTAEVNPLRGVFHQPARSRSSSTGHPTPCSGIESPEADRTWRCCPRSNSSRPYPRKPTSAARPGRAHTRGRWG